MRIGYLVPPAVLAVVLAAAGCGGPEPPAPAPRVGAAAPEITGVDADGQAFRLSDYRGKVVLLSFWHSS